LAPILRHYKEAGREEQWTSACARHKKGAVQTRLLLGPSGTGKTFRCLEEARSALLKSPTGLPLLFLAPKQATFQLERQLLEGTDLVGYSRLRILSFEKLAESILAEIGNEPLRLISEQGRIMVLRALLARKRDQLKLFRATASLRGFAQQLSAVLCDLQRTGLAPKDLLSLASAGRNAPLKLKLEDLAALMQAYLDWLKDHSLRDAEQLLSLASDALQLYPLTSDSSCGASNSDPPLRFEALWLDGFAELAPQEMEFLIALLPCCGRATLALNLDREALVPTSWLSSWSMVGKTCRELQRRLSDRGDVQIQITWLDPNTGSTRFAANPALKHLERNWSDPQAFAGNACLSDSVRIVSCSNREAEAAVAAREILRFVRSGGRYRDTAVIVRNLETYFDPVQRVLRAYEIPYFLDRREPVGHHPLAELTRSALRIVSCNWQNDDWFGALKTGLVHPRDSALDRLENEALLRGWKGADWLEPLALQHYPDLGNWLEGLRQQLVAPFLSLAKDLGAKPTGARLAAGLRSFWDGLCVAETLDRWCAQAEVKGQVDVASLVHRTLWPQMLEWLENIELAFGHEELPLRDWLPIVEAGLAGQTVGVIPPALDQVLVGSVDRSRNPDLKLAVVLGLNESVFPAPPAEPLILTRSDREDLALLGREIGPNARQQISQERYLGYIACTRARERLVLTYASRDEDDQVLNPSAFIEQMQRLFPSLETEAFPLDDFSWPEAEHDCELAGALLEAGPEASLDAQVLLAKLPHLATLAADARRFREILAQQRISLRLADALYGGCLETSVTRLEEFASCPFRFFITSGLRAEERKQFRVDARQQGSFQHEVLARFHEELQQENKRWRDLEVKEARARIVRVAEALIPQYADGLFKADARSQFTARALTASLETFISVMVRWMAQYRFDPHSVELPFGLETSELPAWTMDLGDGHRLSFRGKIDRVDLFPVGSDGSAYCVVIDYKSGAKRIDPELMAHGVQLQLPAYLNVLRSLTDPSRHFRVGRLLAAGVFFVNLRGQYSSAKTRREVLAGFQDARALAYRHTGRFDASVLRLLDARPDVLTGDQFNYRIRKDGQLYANCREALDGQQFGQMLAAVESQLKSMGQQIYAGVAQVDPYRRGIGSACDFCDYKPICRIDPWTHTYRVL
jgi:ATP-dependent helicase/nuclease subunit B